MWMQSQSVIDITESDDIVRTVELIAPVFGAINLEDISAPRCFDIDERVVVLGALINALRLTGRDWNGLGSWLLEPERPVSRACGCYLPLASTTSSGLTEPAACVLGVRISRRPSARSRKRQTHAPLQAMSLEPLSELMFSSVSLGPLCYIGTI